MPRAWATVACIVAVAAARPAGAPSEAAGGDVVASATPAPLPFHYDLLTFEHGPDSTTVVAAIAVPAGRLRRERVDDGIQYRFDVRFVLADTAERTVYSRIDSVFVRSPSPFPREHLLHTFIEVRAPPSAATVQRVVVTDAARPGVGQLYRSPFPIPDYSGRQLMLSDIAFGLPGATSGWTRDGVTLALLPTSQFPESSFEVYYEVYNLPAGSPYETEIAIEPLDEGDGRVVRAVFSGESAADRDETLAELRHVESALERGSYRLTVTVRDQSTGRVASRSRLVDVRGWRAGTTLVQAMPRGR